VVQHAIIAVVARLAVVLWIAWAVVVWNVVFDQVIVLAGRDYIQAALAAGVGPFANMDDWMRPAAVRGAWIATGASAAILLTGVSLCALRRTR
jgi:ABC-type dipeptide/oligopeptide/nickel transport system permease subunit